MASLPNKAARNERRKLTATFVNGVAVAMIAIGGVGPIAGILTGTLPVGAVRTALIASVAWVCLGTILHVGARRHLRGIEE